MEVQGLAEVQLGQLQLDCIGRVVHVWASARVVSPKPSIFQGTSREVLEDWIKNLIQAEATQRTFPGLRHFFQRGGHIHIKQGVFLDKSSIKLRA